MATISPSLTSIVIPAHKEEAGIAHSVSIIKDVLFACCSAWEIIIVDDGSRDGTFRRICELSASDDRIKGISFSRNFGKEAALLAGLNHATGEVVITIDADLQHPPHLIPQMIEAWRNGARVVDAVKRSRKTDGFVTRLRAQLFNQALTRLGGINIENSSDYKLLDRVVVDAITHALPERQRFYRGLADWVGYAHSAIPFDVEDRAIGHSKWSLRGLMGLATTATVSFTSAPLRIVTGLGFITLLFGLVVGTEALIAWFNGNAVSGFTTTILAMLILSSFIMISLGIIGEYIAKIYDEIKQRPAYLIEATVGVPARHSQHSPKNYLATALERDCN